MSVTIEARLAAVEAKLAVIEAQLSAKADRREAPPSVADDRDLDGPYGDPVIKYGLRPKYWPSQPDVHVGKAFSQCPPDYLAAMAKYLRACEYMARKEGDEKKAGFKARDAARAEGWKRRNETTRAAARAPSVPQDHEGDGEAEAFQSQFDDDGIPF